MKILKITFFSCAIFLFCIIVNAQINDTLYIQRNEAGTIEYGMFKINETSNRIMQNDTIFLKSILNARKEDGFRLIKVSKDTEGYIHKRFQQYYKGLKVENQQYLIHGRNGYIITINGDFRIIDIPTVIPSLTEQESLEKAIKYIGAEKYKWEDPEMEKFLKQFTNDPNATYYPQGELVISKDHLIGSNTFKLSWKFILSPTEPDIKQLVYVDACNGNIIHNVPLVLDANIQSFAETKYSGSNQSIMTDSYSSGYRLKELRNNVNISTMNLNHLDNISNAVEFFNPNNVYWDSQNWPSFAADQWALDVHWAAEKTLDFWRVNHGRNSYDNNYGQIRNYVHYWNNYVQACWIPVDHYIKFGDGNEVIGPVTTLDVFAHEFGHGIFEIEVGLCEMHDEIGAINEGLSDIWGAVIENATPKSPGDTDKDCWKIGEELSSALSCFRNLVNPNDANSFGGPKPDTYHGNYWDYYGDCHTNSTVMSHWFYLLSEGGSDTNDNNDAYTVYGIGIDSAQKLVYKLESYLYPTANYENTKNLSIGIANSQVPGGFKAMQVANAWYAVGVGSQPNQMNISGSSTVCKYGTKFQIANLPVGYSITWSCNTNKMHLSSTTSNPTVVYADASGNDGWVQAIISSPYPSVTLRVDNISLNTNDPTISGSTLICSSGATLTFNCACPYDAISWSNGSYLNITSGQGTSSCSFAATGNGASTVYATIYINSTGHTYSKSVWAGKPVVTSINGPTEGYTYTQYNYWTNPSRNSLSQSQYTWVVNPETYGFNYQYYDWVTITFYQPYPYYLVRTRATNTCGASSWVYKNVYIYGYYFSMYPNPASNEVAITINEAECQAIEDNEISEVSVSKAITTDQITYSIRIYNSLGTLVSTATRTGTSFNIPITNLRDGTYIVELNDGKNSYHEQLIIKH